MGGNNIPVTEITDKQCSSIKLVVLSLISTTIIINPYYLSLQQKPELRLQELTIDLPTMT